MYKSFITVLILFSFSVKAQKTLVFDNIKFNSNMRLIGMYPHTDEEKILEYLNFFIDDVKVLDSISKIIVKGVEVKNKYTKTELSIRLFDGEKKVKTWALNPQFSYIRVDGKSYAFDANQIISLADAFGFKYSVMNRSFDSEEDFKVAYKRLKTNKNVLFVYKPDFRFIGKFRVRFEKSKKFPNPKEITKYLEKLIDKNNPEKEYRVYYEYSGYNQRNRNQYTMTIESGFKLYENLKIRKAEKGRWIQNEYVAAVFMKH